ncbi:hypothetical protein [Pantoea ananatis]|uniref:hypothetical protein n=1 Tax=Pantoea ananas TaxID=553 RepID=UPI0011B0F01A|nr:hypothetical protein [Pantoea ananatis]
MEAKKLLEGIIADVVAAKSSNTKLIDIDNLLNYLNGIDVDSFSERPDFELESLKHSNQLSLEIFKINSAAQLETFKSVIAVGANACRALMVINGGAAISLLAFLGNIWNKTSTPKAGEAIALSLAIFCFGILASGICATLTYLTQFSFGNAELGNNKKWQRIGNILNVLACFFGFSSLVAFGAGAYTAFTAMNAQLMLF